MNIIKKTCQENNLTYKDLAALIGYNPYSISNLVSKNDEELPKPLKATLCILKENFALKKSIEKSEVLKKVLKEFLD